MNKEKTLFLAGVLFVQFGAVAIHWGLALALFGVWCLILSYAEHEEKEVSDATASQQLSAGQGMDFRAAEPPEKKTYQKLLDNYTELLVMYDKREQQIKILNKENADLRARLGFFDKTEKEKPEMGNPITEAELKEMKHEMEKMSKKRNNK